MRTKQELLSDVAALPQFEKRKIYLNDNSVIDLSSTPFVEEKRLLAITEKERNAIISTVSKGYKVVQFAEVFQPVIEYFPSCTGQVSYHFGSSVLYLFPEGDEFKTHEGKKIGLIVSNSVNKAMAINVNFTVLVNSHQVVLPQTRGFRQVHLGNVKQIVNDYEALLSQIKESWRTIIDKFSRKLAAEDVEYILSKVKVGKKFGKQIRKEYEVYEHLTLWNLFMDITKKVSDRRYKKEENRVRKLKGIAEAIYDYAVVEAI